MKKTSVEKEVPNYFTVKNNELILTIRVKPKAKKDQIIIDKEGVTVFTKEKPKMGKANKDILHQIAIQYKIPNSSLKIIKGHKSSVKYISIHCKNDTELNLLLKRMI